MHSFFENVRTEVEISSGKDSYLSASIFWRINKEIGYEKESAPKLNNKEEFEAVARKAMNSFIFNKNWNLHEEINAWKSGVLRDISMNFYFTWKKMLSDRFMNKTKFKDGTNCFILEAFCEEQQLDPTSLYVEMIDLLTVSTRLCTSANTTIYEIEQLTAFEKNMLAKHQQNVFLQKRHQIQSKNTIIQQSIRKLENTAKLFQKYAENKIGSYFVIWSLAYEDITSFVYALKAFLSYRKVENFELELSNWVRDMFPKRFLDGRRNLLNESQIHHEIITKLARATDLLYLFIAKNDHSVFQKRDEIIHSNLFSILKNQIEKELEERKNESQIPLFQELASKYTNS